MLNLRLILEYLATTTAKKSWIAVFNDNFLMAGYHCNNITIYFKLLASLPVVDRGMVLILSI